MSSNERIMSKLEIVDLIWAWKVEGKIIQHKPHGKEWCDLTDNQVIKELLYYNMLDGKESYRIKPEE